MTLPFAATVTVDHVAFTGLTGKNYVVPTSHPSNKKIRDTIKELLQARKSGNQDKVAELWANLETLADVKRHVETATNGRVEIKDNAVFYDGEVIHSALASRIIWGISEGFDMAPYVAFMENLMENPSKRAVDELFGFLEKHNMGITEDGHILAYKRVRADYRDIYTGKVNHSVGQKPFMPRNKVDDNKNETCSTGFHFCSMAYLPHFGQRHQGNRIVIVKVNPRDVVSIPADYNAAKARCNTYEVIGEYAGDDTKDILAGRAVWTGNDVERNFGDNPQYDEDTSIWDAPDDLSDYDDYREGDEVEVDAGEVEDKSCGDCGGVLDENDDCPVCDRFCRNCGCARHGGPCPQAFAGPAEVPEESSFISNISYDGTTNDLLVSFHSGQTYTYRGVPRHVFEAFRDAPSKGGYFNDHILRHYIGKPL